MNRKTLVIGQSSFIASHWRQLSPGSLIAVGHAGLSGQSAQGFGVVVNCATAPTIKTEPYREDADNDLRAARLAADADAHFVMLSTRKVYAAGSTATAVLGETSPVGPSDRYGENKLESERRVVELLGDRCTILRIANVYGHELGRRSFLGMAQTRLRDEQRIVLDVSPFVERDFISVTRLAGMLDRVCERRPAGTYNLGSGVALPIGRIAQWLIQGYGRGRLEVIDMSERDAFVMDVGKLNTALGIAPEPHPFEQDFKALGFRLNNDE